MAAIGHIKLLKLLKFLGGAFKKFQKCKQFKKFYMKLFSKFGIQERDWELLKVLKFNISSRKNITFLKFLKPPPRSFKSSKKSISFLLEIFNF